MPLIQIEDTRQGARRPSVTCHVGRVPVGGSHPVVVQSMTNTDTADASATADQIALLAAAGSEIVRITVNTRESAAAVPEIKQRLLDRGHAVRRRAGEGVGRAVRSAADEAGVRRVRRAGGARGGARARGARGGDRGCASDDRDVTRPCRKRYGRFR